MPSPRHIEVVRSLERINADLRRGKFRTPRDMHQAADDVLILARELDEMPPEQELLDHAALAYQLAGSFRFEAGNIEGGIDCWMDAGDRFERSGSATEHRARFFHDFAVVAHELSIDEFALKLARQAQIMMKQLGITEIDGRPITIDEFVIGLERGRHAVPTKEDVEHERDRFRKARRGRRADAAQALTVALLDSGTAGAHLSELHDSLKVAFFECWRNRRRFDDAVAVLQTMIELHWQQLPLPGWTRKAAEQVIDRAESLGRIDFVADALAVLGASKLSEGDKAGGLDTLLAAVAVHDEFSLSSESVVVRNLSSRPNDYARQFAIHTAAETGDFRLMAELIEAARLQVEPLPLDTSQPEGLRRSRVGNLRPVTVDGRSRLLEHYRHTRTGRPVELHEVIAAIGGTPDAAWWGTWTANERVYWALWLDDQWTGGEISLSEGSPIRQTFWEALESSTLTPKTSIDDILSGPWCRTSFSEERTSTELGEALLPETLKQKIRGAPRSEPFSLVVAGTLFAMVPVALLGVQIDVFSSRRLVEAAVIRLAAPASLIDKVNQRWSPDVKAYPLQLACLDPRGDLANSRDVPPGARHVLSGDPQSDWPRPSLSNLAEALSQHPPGAPALFYYTGHAASEGAGGDDSDGLALYGGDVLSAAQLFIGVADGRGPYFPSRVLLSACASSGAQGAGAGEWLGLTAAILWAGAKSVVATTWPIWDTPFTSDFDHDLALAMQTPIDPAVALRATQLKCLDAWRLSDHDLSEEVLPSELAQMPFPLMWAAFVSIGTA
jgi:hypothetical protein